MEASARRAATAVAVAPTLDAKSQLSPSDRSLSVIRCYERVAVRLTMVRSWEASSSGYVRP